MKKSSIPEQLRKVDLRAIDDRIRLDAWQNEVTGFGTSRDKTTYGRWIDYGAIPDAQLTALYNGSDIAARIVDAVPDEMFREGFEVDLGDNEPNTWISERLEELNVLERFADAERWARLYGGAAILIGANDGRAASMPLIPERANGVRYLYVIDRRMLWPLTYYSQSEHPKLGEPETYLVTVPGHTSTTAIVHETRLIRFAGSKVDAQTKQQLAGWDLSVLQRPAEVIRMFDTGWKAVEHMLTDGNQTVMKIRGLVALLAEKDGMEQMQKRLRAIELYRSSLRSVVVDAGGKDEGGNEDNPESLERLSVSFEGIPLTLDKFCLRLAASVPMPVTILMGQSPAGMNATGESDFRWWNDRNRSRQTITMTPKIRRLVSLILRAKDSPIAPEKIDTISVKWCPLWTPTPDAEAERRNKNAQTDKLYYDMGALEPEEIALSRFRPEGYGEEIKLDDASLAAREKALATTLKPAEGSENAARVVLAPTGVEKIVTVNEARAGQGLGPLSLPDGSPDPKGAKTIAEAAAEAEAAAGGGGGGFGGGFGGGPPKPVSVNESTPTEDPAGEEADGEEADGSPAPNGELETPDGG